MTITLDHPSPANLRRAGVSGRTYESTIMEIIATDEKPKSLPPYPTPVPSMHRITHSEPHGLPSGPGAFDHSWRQYPSPIDNHPPEQRRTASAPQPPLPSHPYPAIQNRELPQLPDGPYGRPGSLPTPAHNPSEPPAPPPPPPPPPHGNFHHMNGAPHEPAPHSAPPDYRPRMSFHHQDSHSNGDPPPPPPTIPQTQYPTTVPPVSHTPAPYENFYQNQAYGMRQRKAARAQQACDQCRTRKAKCDEGRPACSHCKENNLICVYKEVPPHKQEKTTQLLLDRMQQIEDKFEERFTQFQAMQVEQSVAIAKITADAKLKEAIMPNNEEPANQPGNLFSKPDIPDLQQEPESKEKAAPIVGRGSKALEKLLQIGEDGELSIPVEHTTAAHKLLGWPMIKQLLSPYQYDEDYPMKLEEDRGLIRVYGRGEGDESSQATSTPQKGLNPNPNWDERYSHNQSPGGTWNTNANTNANGRVEAPEFRAINDAGVLCIDAETIHRYHCSYMEHIHKLHPFLDQHELETKINMFIKLYCPKRTPPPASTLAHNGLADPPRGAKRKRSCEPLSIQSPTGIKLEYTSGREIERTIDNAIILLILALGRICEVRFEPIKGPVTDRPVDFRNEYIPGASPEGLETTIPSQSSFYLSQQGRSLSSPSISDGLKDNSHLRNIDTIPGLVFYSYATNILGNLQGANRLPHVHAALLAGLYSGQLAHPFQSHGWISQAARACQVLVRSKRYDKMKDGHEKDLLNFAYWTCLQLESDILAELDLPASGISRSEARILLPKGKFTLTLPNDISAPTTMMMFFYSAQIHLRKVLNRVHTDLYKVEKQGAQRWSINVQEILSMNLELWRNSLPEVMRWKDTDPPSSDINVARMRAKYYGARYIINRPLLYHVLHEPMFSREARSSPLDSPTGSAVSGSKSQQLSPSLTHNQRAPNMMRMSSDMGMSSNAAPLPAKLRRACRACLEAAVLSTEAFDGIKGRPVITNIFGTAHAQFGNMLVLSATYVSHLSDLVDPKVLERLLKRTISFLLQSQNISPTLRADAKILTQIYQKIFQESPGSFSSQM